MTRLGDSTIDAQVAFAVRAPAPRAIVLCNSARVRVRDGKRFEREVRRLDLDVRGDRVITLNANGSRARVRRVDDENEAAAVDSAEILPRTAR